MTATTSAAPPRRSVAGRALLAVLLLLGFYLLALAIIGALAAVNVAFLSNGRVPARFLVFSAIIAFALLRGMFFVEKQSHTDEVVGIRVTERDEPGLWGLVRELATKLGTEPPARLYLTPDVNAFVFQRSRLLGLVPGERVMGVGVPLLHVLSVDELRGVLAHEFGHYTGGDTRLGALVYRGRASIGRTIRHLGEDSWIAKLFNLYGRLYLRVSQAVSRGQELAADANAARLVGPAAHASALRRVHVAGPVFGSFMERYVEPLWEQGARPRDLYAGFREFHDHPEHTESLARLATEMTEEEGDRYDSHPPLGERLAALGTAPAATLEPAAERARDLLADPAALDARMSELLSELVAEGRPLRAVDWDESAAATMLGPVVRDDRERLFAGVAKLTHEPGSIASAFDLVEAGRVVELAAAIDKRVHGVPREERDRVAVDVVADALAGAVAEALTTERDWRWALQWSGPATLVTPAGEPWPFGKVVYAAVGEPSRVPALRADLRAHGLAV